jgi:hypothetical protein
MTVSARMPVIYFIVGQAGWFACVLSAAHGSPAIGAVIVAILLTMHLAYIPRPLLECRFLAFVVLLGTVWESVLVRTHLLGYPSGVLIEGFAPYWIVALWALFGAQFNTSYKWLKHRLIAAAILGAIAGPASFRAGAALGALQFIRPWPATVILAAGWAVILPLLALASRRWDGARSA